MLNMYGESVEKPVVAGPFVLDGTGPSPASGNQEPTQQDEDYSTWKAALDKWRVDPSDANKQALDEAAEDLYESTAVCTFAEKGGGFTGERTDRLGRKTHWVNGRRVAAPRGDEHAAAPTAAEHATAARQAATPKKRGVANLAKEIQSHLDQAGVSDRVTPNHDEGHVLIESDSEDNAKANEQDLDWEGVNVRRDGNKVYVSHTPKAAPPTGARQATNQASDKSKAAGKFMHWKTIEAVDHARQAEYHASNGDAASASVSHRQAAATHSNVSQEFSRQGNAEAAKAHDDAAKEHRKAAEAHADSGAPKLKELL